MSLAGRRALSRAEALSHVGGGVQQLIRNALVATGGTNAALEADLLPRHTEWYKAHLTDHTRPFPGAVAALEALTVRGVAMGVATNKREAISRQLLDHLDLARFFTVVIGGDTFAAHRMKPAPDALLELQARCGGGAWRSSAICASTSRRRRRRGCRSSPAASASRMSRWRASAPMR
ncbi:HAD family hydrolase [Sphingomonas sp. MMS24-JH45]